MEKEILKKEDSLLNITLPNNVDKRVYNILNEIVSSCTSIFKDNIVGIYLHGSVAFGCFSWDKSDIDFIVIVKEDPPLNEKVNFIKDLLQIDLISPQKGLEMSFVLSKFCNPFVYPTPYILHFSNDHKSEAKKNIENYCKTMNGLDKDLASHFSIIKSVGICLFGKSIKEIFGIVPKENYKDSIIYDILNIDIDIKNNPVYIILNCCRIIAFFNYSLILSKKEGGEWGIKNISNEFRDLIERCLKDYENKEKFKGEEKELEEFAKYIHKELNF